MTDDELMEALVRMDKSAVRALERWDMHPLALPSPTPVQKRRFDALWDEAQKRGLVGPSFIEEWVRERKNVTPKRADLSNVVVEIKAAVAQGEKDGEKMKHGRREVE